MGCSTSKIMDTNSCELNTKQHPTYKFYQLGQCNRNKLRAMFKRMHKRGVGPMPMAQRNSSASKSEIIGPRLSSMDEDRLSIDQRKSVSFAQRQSVSSASSFGSKKIHPNNNININNNDNDEDNNNNNNNNTHNHNYNNGSKDQVILGNKENEENGKKESVENKSNGHVYEDEVGEAETHTISRSPSFKVYVTELDTNDLCDGNHKEIKIENMMENKDHNKIDASDCLEDGHFKQLLDKEHATIISITIQR